MVGGGTGIFSVQVIGQYYGTGVSTTSGRVIFDNSYVMNTGVENSTRTISELILRRVS